MLPQFWSHVLNHSLFPWKFLSTSFVDLSLGFVNLVDLQRGYHNFSLARYPYGKFRLCCLIKFVGILLESVGVFITTQGTHMKREGKILKEILFHLWTHKGFGNLCRSPIGFLKPPYWLIMEILMWIIFKVKLNKIVRWKNQMLS